MTTKSVKQYVHHILDAWNACKTNKKSRDLAATNEHIERGMECVSKLNFNIKKYFQVLMDKSLEIMRMERTKNILQTRETYI